jgi:hypothetical protein
MNGQEVSKQDGDSEPPPTQNSKKKAPYSAEQHDAATEGPTRLAI